MPSLRPEIVDHGRKIVQSPESPTLDYTNTSTQWQKSRRTSGTISQARTASPARRETASSNVGGLRGGLNAKQPPFRIGGVGTTGKPLAARETISFLDSDSEPDEGQDGVIQRANTVRLYRPKLVEHRHSTAEKEPVPDEGTEPDITQGRREKARGFALPNTRQNKYPNFSENLKISPVDKTGERSLPCLPPLSPRRSISSESMLEDPVSEEEEAEVIEAIYSPIRNRTGPQPSNRNPYNPVRNKAAGRQSHPINQSIPRTSNPTLAARQSISIQTEGMDRQNNGRRNLRHSHIVTTPYPTSRYSALPTDSVQEKSPTKQQARSKNENLFVTLSLYGGPHRQHTVIITIPTDSEERFDDAALFKQFQKSYHNRLLPAWKRWLSVRRLDRVVLELSDARGSCQYRSRLSDGDLNGQRTGHLDFDPHSFLEYLRYPKLGSGKKRWLQWVRQNQKLFIPDIQKSLPPGTTSYQAGGQNDPNFVDPSQQGNGHASRPTPSHGSRGGWSFSAGTDSDGRTTSRPKAVIQLRHLLSPGLVSFALVFILLLGITAAVLWITLGPAPPTLLPRPPNPPPNLGVRPIPPSGGGKIFKVDVDIDQAHKSWRDVVTGRVPAGFVVGFVVMSFGVVGLLGWLGVSVLAWRRASI